MEYPTIESTIGNTPLVKLQRLPGKTSNHILVKLEGNNPAGSVKDRPALNMLQQAHAAGVIKSGDVLIEATSGNTGIGLAMAAAILGYRMRLIMPASMSVERRASMKAYGAEIILVTKEEGIEGARDLAERMAKNGEGILLDQFANEHNPEAHFFSTGPEIWEQTAGEVSHFVSTMGTTGTIMGNSRLLKQKNNEIQIVGVQPASDQDSIPGIRRWAEAYLPAIYDAKHIDQVVNISQSEAEETMRSLAVQEGIFSGVSAGGAVAAALQLSKTVSNATIVVIIPDRGDRYISTGIYPS